MAKHLAYAMPSDVRAGTYSGIGLTVLGSQYPFSTLGDREPSQVFIANETTGRMVFDASAKVDIKAVFLGHHRYAATRVVRLEGSDASDFGSIGLSQDVTVPAWRRDRFARNLWWDLETRLPNAADRSWRYWSVSPTTANDAAIAAGLLLFFTALRRLGRNIGWDVTETIDHDVIDNSTKFGVHSVYEMGSRGRTAEATVPQADDATRNAIDDLREDARSSARPFFVALAGDEDASDLRKEPQWVSWDGGPLSGSHRFIDLHTVALRFKELGCGLPY